MNDNKFVGIFHSEIDVLNKIDELKVQGYMENDIYVVTDEADTLSMVRGQTNVELRSPDGNWLDRFLMFLSGDEPVKGAFRDMGFTEEESSRYYNEVKNGGILLYVDQEYGNLFNEKPVGYHEVNVDPNIGANTFVNESTTINPTINNLSALNTETTDEQEELLYDETLNTNDEQFQAIELDARKQEPYGSNPLPDSSHFDNKENSSLNGVVNEHKDTADKRPYEKKSI